MIRVFRLAQGKVAPTVTKLEWYGIQVRPRWEFRVCEEFGRRGLEAFLPARRERRRWSDRVKELEVPLFPSYVFCRFRVHERVPVLATPSVIRIVGIAKQPCPISEREIESIKTLVTSRLVLSPWPYLAAGRRIWINHGPLAGLEGTVVEAEDGKPRVVVSVTMLQRSVAAEVERDWVDARPESLSHDARCRAIEREAKTKLLNARTA